MAFPEQGGSSLLPGVGPEVEAVLTGSVFSAEAPGPPLQFTGPRAPFPVRLLSGTRSLAALGAVGGSQVLGFYHGLCSITRF